MTWLDSDDMLIDSTYGLHKFSDTGNATLPVIPLVPCVCKPDMSQTFDTVSVL